MTLIAHLKLPEKKRKEFKEDFYLKLEEMKKEIRTRKPTNMMEAQHESTPWYRSKMFESK